MISEDELYESNLRLNREEFAQRRIHLLSLPRYLTVGIGTACNINCSYCYQIRTADKLLSPEYFGDHLRRELAAFYPFLSTLRVQGGEVFMIPGFEELVAEVTSSVKRPIISISTNGTLIDAEWAERIVGIPFQCVTFSLDGATPETFERLRKGASLKQVLANIDRIQTLKSRRQASLPDIDLFFLIMRSTYREIPAFLELAREHGIERVVFQLLLVDERNLSRDPGLAAEIDFNEREVHELYELIRGTLEKERGQFKNISVSGLQSLFDRHNLDAGFLDEGRFSIYPDGESHEPAIEATVDPIEKPAVSGGSEAAIPSSVLPKTIRLCPNPWTQMYVTETGAVHICSMLMPAGNLYETPLMRIWNSPGAVAARSDMILGRYQAAGCSQFFCSWREGKLTDQPTPVTALEEIDRFRILTRKLVQRPQPLAEPDDPGLRLMSIRRMLTERNQRIAELESSLAEFHKSSRHCLESADNQNRLLASRIAALEDLLHLTSEEIPVTGTVSFGKGLWGRLGKKIAIGAAIRSIQLLDRASAALRKFVNRLCAR